MIDQDYQHKLQGRREWRGIKISIENKKGSIRSGVDPDGKPWSIKMKHAYGRIPRTEGTDGDAVDVYLGPDLKSDLVFIVHQQDPWKKKYDEDKLFIGFNTIDQVKKAFLSQYNRKDFLGPIDIVSSEVLKEMLKNNGKKGKPLGSSRVQDARAKVAIMRILDGYGTGRTGEAVEESLGDGPEEQETLNVLQSEGTHQGHDYSQFDQRNLAIGVFIELEHADSVEAAMEIAADHLAETPDYYTNPHNPFLTELHKEIMPIVQKSMKTRGISTEEVGMGKTPKEKLDALKSRRDTDGVEDSKFSELVNKIMREQGYSKERASAIAASICRKKKGLGDAGEHIGWEAMVKKLKGQGHSQESAEKIAYSIGRKKYGKAGMAKKAAAGRKDSEPDELSEVQDDLGMGVELLITPLIKKLMQKLGFQKMRWIGRGWFVPITGTTYQNYLTKIPFFKAFDDQFKKFGYQIRISPVGFFVEPVGNGKGMNK